MEKQEIDSLLKQELKIQKDVVALKPLKEIPKNIEAYDGCAAPGLCTQIGEILNDGSVFYVQREHNGCYEGLIATGVCTADREEYLSEVESFMEMSPYHIDLDTAMRYYDNHVKQIPPPEADNACLLVGPLSKIDDPDLLLIFCTPVQAEVLIRAQSYLGSMVHGFGGNGGCVFNIRYSFVTRKPSFSTSDVAWRVFTGMNGNELTVTYPYEKLVAAAPYLKPIHKYVDTMTSLMDQT